MFLLDRLLGALRVRRHSPERVHRQTLPISRRLSENLIYISRTLSDAPDLVQRKLQIGKNGTAAMLFYLTGLTNETTIQESVLRPLLHYTGHTVAPEAVQQEVLEAGRVRLLSDLNLTISELLRGQLVLLLDGSAQSIAIEARQYPGRAVTEPTAEKTITGPREGFVENIQQNTALVRRRLPSPNFKSRTLQLGTITRTNISVCYMEDKVQTGLLEEVLQRLEHLQQFDLPEVLDTSYVGQAIEDHPLSPFPQTMSTERPDRTVANLLEGRVCILVDGTPKALIIPAGLFDQFQSPEDYYQRPWVATMARWIRYLAAVLATTSSALYVAILTFHYEVIPHRLIVNVARSRSLVPFPVLFEALALEFAVELLREATNRLPSTVGQVIGVVGALVLGQAAVEASLVSQLLVIVVAISTIASFTIPNNPAASALRLMRFPLILAAGFL